MMAIKVFAAAFNSPIIRFHSRVRAEEEEEAEEERRGEEEGEEEAEEEEEDGVESRMKRRKLKAQTSCAPPRQPEANVAK